MIGGPTDFRHIGHMGANDLNATFNVIYSLSFLHFVFKTYKIKYTLDTFQHCIYYQFSFEENPFSKFSGTQVLHIGYGIFDLFYLHIS